MSESKPSCQSEPAPPSPVAGSLITLQVGEQRFVTTSETLQESAFFSTLLSGRWDNTQADGSYFIDADARIFDHVLRYLRRGVLPVFYDNAKGHDHALYLALLEEAKYFQIPRLERWIEDRTYLEAVKIKYSTTELDGANTVAETTRTDTEIGHPFYVKGGVSKVYGCPYGTYPHECSSICGSGGPVEYKQILKTLVIGKTIVLDRDLCREGR
jgi:BTB/POZ domain-containing protein KCTD9